MLEPHEVAEMERASDYYSDHPLARKFIDWVRGGGGHITKPWQVLGLKYYKAAGLLRGQYTVSNAVGESLPEGAEKAGSLELALHMMASDAQMYLWDKPTLRLCLDTEVPDHRIDSELLPYPAVMMVFDVPVSIRNEGKNIDCTWVMAYRSEEYNGIMIAFDQVTDGMLGCAVSGIEYGKLYPHDFSLEARPGVAQILKMMAFIKSPFIGSKPSKLERKDIERIQRTKGYQDNTDNGTQDTVHFIQLRREAKQALEEYARDKAAYERTPIKERGGWWWVSGHNRKQPYPSRNTHEMIWIAPYKKGNRDGDLMQKIYHVNR